MYLPSCGICRYIIHTSTKSAAAYKLADDMAAALFTAPCYRFVTPLTQMERNTISVGNTVCFRTVYPCATCSAPQGALTTVVSLVHIMCGGLGNTFPAFLTDHNGLTCSAFQRTGVTMRPPATRTQGPASNRQIFFQWRSVQQRNRTIVILVIRVVQGVLTRFQK